MANKRPVAVIGLGVTGCQTAALFAAAGHPVTVYDKLKSKRELARKGECPAFEIQVTNSFQQAAKSGKIRVVDKLAEVWKGTTLVFLTPGLTDDLSLQTSFAPLRKAVVEIAEQYQSQTRLTMVCRYATYVGAYQELFANTVDGRADLAVVLNPSLHRQSHAITDVQNSRLHVAASPDAAAAQEVAELYQSLNLPCEVVRIETAELLAPVCGAFHALKVSFANEVASIANQYKVNADQLLELVAKDSLLNTSAAYLRPGNAWSGPHLPRAVRHMADLAGTSKLKLPLLTSLEASNNAHFTRLKRELEQVNAQRIGLFGLAYRADTDDTRGSNAIRIVESLQHEGKEVRIFDPQIQYDRLDDANLHNLLMELPLAERILTPNFQDLLEWSQHLVLVHAPNRTQAAQIQNKAIPVLNWSGSALNRVA